MSVADGGVPCCVYSHIKADKNQVIFTGLMLQESIHWSFLDLIVKGKK